MGYLRRLTFKLDILEALSHLLPLHLMAGLSMPAQSFLKHFLLAFVDLLFQLVMLLPQLCHV